MRLSDLSIKRPVFLFMVLFAIVLFGSIAYFKTGIDLYPKVQFPVVTVVTSLPGSDPETVENQLTDPIEESLSTISSIKHLRSISRDSISQVVIEFELEKDERDAYQEVQAKIGALRSRLPADAIGPTVEKFDLDTLPVITLIVSADLPTGELTRLVNKEIKEPLQRIPQVGQIRITGGREQKIWLHVDRNRLDAYQISLQEIEAAIQKEHFTLSSGRLTQGSSEFLLKTEAEFQSAEQLSNLIVAYRNDLPIYFKQIGSVEDGLAEERSIARKNGVSAISLSVGCQSGANTVVVADSVKKAVTQLQSSLAKKHVVIESTQDNSHFIKRSVEEVRFHLVVGGGFAILIVLLFLRNIRSTVVCGLALPTAVIGTFAFMSFMGFTQNMMTLLGLSIAIGLLIDDAIVVQENIIRHLEEGKSSMEAASIGAKEITLAVFATTLAVVAVFVPVAFMKGMVGRFFYQFGLTVSFAVLISLFVSFTLNPMFSSRFLKMPKKGALYQFLEKQFQKLESLYASVLRFSLRRKGLVAAVALLSFFSSLFVARYLRFEFTPLEDQSEFSISCKAPQDSSLAHTGHLVEQIEAKVRALPWVEYIFTTIGADTLESINIASIYVKIVDKNRRPFSQAQAMGLVRQELASLTDCQITIEPVQKMQGSGRKMTDIQLELRGPDLSTLSTIATNVVDKLQLASGYVDISSSYETGKPQVNIAINREAAHDLAIPPFLAAKTIRTAFGGEKIATLKRDADRIDIALRFQDSFRSSPEQLSLISLKNSRGEWIPLSQIIQLQNSSSPTQIDRYNRVRQLTVYANLDRSQKILGEAITEIQQIMAEQHLPDSYNYGFAGMANNFKESFFNLAFALILAIVIVYMVLAAQFESFVQPFIIMLSMPLSIVGAIGALVLCGMTMNIFTMIGMIMLMGLVTKNGILLVDFIKQHATQGDLSLDEAIVKAGTYRLRPILMTTLAIILGSLPIALGVGSGSESQAPMAVAVIGGLITSTLLTLIVVPVAYASVAEFHWRKLLTPLLLLWHKLHPKREPTL